MSRRTPIEELREEESGVETPSRRRSSRIAATVTTRRASASEDTPGKITKSKRSSLSQENSLGTNSDAKTSFNGPSTPQKKITTRSASKSPSALPKMEEAKSVPAVRTRRRVSTSSLMDEETQKEERAASPVLSKMTTRRRSLRSMSTSPTSEAAAGNSKASTPRKSTRAISVSPTNDLTKSAPPKLRGRRPSVTEKIIPLESIEETEPKTEEAAATKASNKSQTTENSSADEEKSGSTIEEHNDENLPFKKKKAAMLKKQNLQTITEKITEESEIGGIVDDEALNKEKLDISTKEETTSVNDNSLKESSSEVDEASKKSDDLDSITENVETADKKAETPESKVFAAKYSLGLKSKRSPGESVEEKELKAVLDVDEKQAGTNSPRRSPRLSGSDIGNPGKTKQSLQTCSDMVNITGGSEESFHLKLNLSQFDASQENLEQQKYEEKASLPNISHEIGMNTSGSSNTSDKENQHQAKVLENVENVTKKKLIILTDNLNFEQKNPIVEKTSTPEISRIQQKSRTSRSSFYEPMEVDEYPSDYEYSGLEKKDETDTSPTKKPSEQLKSPKTSTILDKSTKVLESPKTVESNKSLTAKSPKLGEIGETFNEKVKILECPLEASPKQDSPAKHSSISPILKTTFDLSETDVLKIDVSQIKAYSLTTELAKANSPKRRSARFLNQSKNENLEEEEKCVVNSTTKQKPFKGSIDKDLENNMEVSLNETTVSIDERDLKSTKDSQSPLNEIIIEANRKKESNDSKELVNEDSVKNYVPADRVESIAKSQSSNKCVNKEIIEKDLQEKEDQNESIVNVVVDKINKTSSPEKSTSKDNFNKNECKLASHLDVTKLEDEEITKNPNLKTPQEKVENNNSDEPKFSEDSDSQDIRIDQSERNVSMRRKSRGKVSFGEQGKSKGDSNNEESKVAEDSDSGNCSKKDLSKSEPILRNKSNGKEDSEQKRKSDEDDEVPKFSEDSDSEDNSKKDQSKTDSILKSKSKDNKKDYDQQGKLNKGDEEPNFSEESESEDAIKKDTSKRDSTTKRKSIFSKNDESSNFSEDSDNAGFMSSNWAKRDSASRNKQKDKGQRKIVSDEEGDEEPSFSDSDDDIRAPFLLYTVKSKKSVDSKPIKPSLSKDNDNSSNEDKGKRLPSLITQTPTIVINSGSDTEKGNASDLDVKISTLIANQCEEGSSSSSSYESVTHFLDDLAEEGEEDTPSEGSNDIVDRGESVGSTESEINSDDTYENDSFIDDHEEVELLSGEEYDLGQQKEKKRPKKKHSRIITVSDSEEDNKENELPAANKVNVKQREGTVPKEKVTNGIEEDSDLEKMSTQPYCGLTPPSVMSLRDSLSDSEKIESKEEITSSVLINREDNLQSLEELKQHEVSIKVLETSTDRNKVSLQLTPKAAQVVPTTFTPNNSILEDESAESNKIARKRQSSITIQENIKLQDIAEGSVSDRISKVVDVFCSSVKGDGKDHAGNISLNISLEFVKSPFPSKENSEEENEEKSVEVTLEEEVRKKRLTSELLNESKSKMEKVIKLRNKKGKKQELEKESVVEAVEKVLKKRLSPELTSEPNPMSEDQIKRSAKKQKFAKTQDHFKISSEDLIGTKKRLSKELVGKSSSVDQLKKQNETIISEPEEDWETLSDDDSNKNDDLPIKEKLTKKDRKKKKKQKNVSLIKTVDNEGKTEEKEKQSNMPSDSDMSEDLDAELNEKYNSNAYGELDEAEEKAEPKIIAHVDTEKSRKKKSAKKSGDIIKQLYSVDDDEGIAASDVLVKKVVKRKRNKSANLDEDLVQKRQKSKTILKTKKQKDKSKPKDQQESTPIPLKKYKNFKIAREAEVLSDEVFLEETKKKGKKSTAEEIEPKNVGNEPSNLKKKKIKYDQAGPSSGIREPEESKFHYFPSRILNTLTKNEKLKKSEEMPDTSNQPKKPKLLPSSNMAKRSWTADVVEEPLLPSKNSAKKMKMDLESINRKDFKNLMLYDPSRVKRMDSKNLLKKQQNRKF